MTTRLFVASLQTALNFWRFDARSGSCCSGLGAWTASPLTMTTRLFVASFQTALKFWRLDAGSGSCYSGLGAWTASPLTMMDDIPRRFAPNRF
jgi:hypothetical protein